MNTNIQTFNFNQNEVRTIVKDGNPWFVASDIAKQLDYAKTVNLMDVLDDDEADTANIGIRSENGVEQSRQVSIINESGLYHAIFKSRKAEAKAFRKWVTSEVLPSIRKNGSYKVSQPYELEHEHGHYKGAAAEVAQDYDWLIDALVNERHILAYRDFAFAQEKLLRKIKILELKAEEFQDIIKSKDKIIALLSDANRTLEECVIREEYKPKFSRIEYLDIIGGKMLIFNALDRFKNSAAANDIRRGLGYLGVSRIDKTFKNEDVALEALMNVRLKRINDELPIVKKTDYTDPYYASF